MNEVMDSVMIIAKELELSITLNRDYTAKHLNEVNIDSIKALFRGLATIKGRYMMNIEKQTKDSVVIRQYKRDKKRTKRLAGVKTERNGYVEFETESLNGGNYSFSGDCKLFWSYDNEGYVINPFSIASVQRKVYGGIWYETSFNVNMSDPETVLFLGNVEVYAFDSGINYTCIFYYEAHYFPSFPNNSFVIWT